MTSDLRRLQLEELAILEDFVAACEEYGLRYYLLGGTLLGAVRHKGFIPWDDDVDVAMPRVDYDRLISLWDSRECEYTMVTPDTPGYRYPWARLESSRVRIRNHSANVPRIENAWIDIIPFDSIPDNPVLRTLHKTRLSLWWNLNQIVQFDELVDQKRQRSLPGRLAISLASKFKWIGSLVDYKTTLRGLNRTLMKYPYDMDTRDIINFLAAYGFDEIFPRQAFAETALYDFEGRQFVGPKDYHEVCLRIYGDSYMELPPEDERNKHNAEILDDDELG
ncbi:MAG: LicD family protein [Actinomycetaceae bacterium]|nr:LicD family protein [Actinomycetaceae bacterium]